MLTLSSVSLRAEKASQILFVPPVDLLKVLADEGITNNDAGIELLDSPTTTVDDLVDILTKDGLFKETVGIKAAAMGKKAKSKLIKKIPAKAAATVLKGTDPFEKEFTGKIEVVTPPATSSFAVDTLVKTIVANRDIHNMRDKELLEAWITERDYEMEQELHHNRAKGQRFIVLKDGKQELGKEVVDIEASLELLRLARRRKNPSIIPVGNTVANVFFITQLNMQDRIVEICPLCGKILYKGYCSDCESNFTGIGDDERAYMKLISESDKFDVTVYSDRKAIYASATKGLDDLRKTWPSMIEKFDELKLTNNLPKLRQIEDRPSREVQDPFHTAGNRKF